MQMRWEAAKQVKQLPVWSNQHYFPPADQRPLFCNNDDGSSWETSQGESWSKKVLLQSLLQSIQLYLIPNQKALLCIVSDALHLQIQRWIRGDQSECSELIKHHRGCRRFIKSWFRGGRPHWAPLPSASLSRTGKNASYWGDEGDIERTIKDTTGYQTLLHNSYLKQNISSGSVVT